MNAGDRWSTGCSGSKCDINAAIRDCRPMLGSCREAGAALLCNAKTFNSECSATSGVGNSSADATNCVQMPVQTSNSQAVLTVRSTNANARAQACMMCDVCDCGFWRLGLGLCLRQLNIRRLTTQNSNMCKPMHGNNAAKGSETIAAAALTKGLEMAWAQNARTQDHKNSKIAMRKTFPTTPLPTANLLATTKQGP
jgi:hypothetical protein